MLQPTATCGTTQAEVTQWAKGLEDVAKRIAARFSRLEPRQRTLHIEV